VPTGKKKDPVKREKPKRGSQGSGTVFNNGTNQRKRKPRKNRELRSNHILKEEGGGGRFVNVKTGDLGVMIETMDRKKEWWGGCDFVKSAKSLGEGQEFQNPQPFKGLPH